MRVKDAAKVFFQALPPEMKEALAALARKNVDLLVRNRARRMEKRAAKCLTSLFQYSRAQHLIGYNRGKADAYHDLIEQVRSAPDGLTRESWIVHLDKEMRRNHAVADDVFKASLALTREAEEASMDWR